MTFAERLRELRDKAGLTQETLAEESGVPIWTLRNYEQGRREPNWKGFLHLADALGVKAEAFRDCTSKDEEEPVRKKASKTGKSAAAKGKRKN